MKKLNITLMTLLVSLCLSQASFARGFGGYNQGSRGATQSSQNESSRILRIAPILGLSDAQVAEIEVIIDANKEDISVLKGAINELRTTLKDQGMAGEYDAENVRLLADTLASHIADIVVIKAEERNAIMQLLTAEQLEKLQEMRTFFGNRHNQDVTESL